LRLAAIPTEAAAVIPAKAGIFVYFSLSAKSENGDPRFRGDDIALCSSALPVSDVAC
jgi:hypothetical protein